MAARIAKRLFNDMDRRELVSFAYHVQTGAAVEPEIAAELYRERFESAVRLAVSHKVSVTKAASIAGMVWDDFVAELVGMGYHPYCTDRKVPGEPAKSMDGNTGR